MTDIPKDPARCRSKVSDRRRIIMLLNNDWAISTYSCDGYVFNWNSSMIRQQNYALIGRIGITEAKKTSVSLVDYNDSLVVGCLSKRICSGLLSHPKNSDKKMTIRKII